MRAGMDPGAASSSPAVSMTVTLCPASTASPSRRSRVRPGMSDTSAVRLRRQAIEKGRLADIGPADNGDNGGMGVRVSDAER